MIVIGGSSDRNQETAGAFQEFPQVLNLLRLDPPLPPPHADASVTRRSCQLVSQVEACRLYSKFSARPSSLEAIPSVVEKVGDCFMTVSRSSLLLDHKKGK